MSRPPIPKNWKSVGVGAIEGATIRYFKHSRTGLFMALSDDFPELRVNADSPEGIAIAATKAVLAIRRAA